MAAHSKEEVSRDAAGISCTALPAAAQQLIHVCDDIHMVGISRSMKTSVSSSS
jgi:hypothetical protein